MGNDTFVKTQFDKLYTDNTLYRPMSPSVWVSEAVSYQPITKLTMTCGGGLGGSRWEEFIKRIPIENICCGGDFSVVESWDGKKFLLNKRYLVKGEQLTIASAVLRSTNPNFPQGDYTYCWLVEDGHVLELGGECRPLR